jgi:hypothetical protein
VRALAAERSPFAVGFSPQHFLFIARGTFPLHGGDRDGRPRHGVGDVVGLAFEFIVRRGDAEFGLQESAVQEGLRGGVSGGLLEAEERIDMIRFGALGGGRLALTPHLGGRPD